jgi:LmbE family N-acetylglucosaminyl deacetylase
MSKLSRRSLLSRSPVLLAGAAASFAAPKVAAPENHASPERKLRVVAVGGHFDDPQSCAGGTLALYAQQGHDVVGLSITGGPPPAADADPNNPKVKNHRNAIRMAQILGIRLVSLNYDGSNSGQFTLPIVYRDGCEINGQRYMEFNEILLDQYKPDIVFTHWPIDLHPDHRAASLLTFNAWLASGRRFPLYYMEAELGTQTQNYYPTDYVDITAVADLTHQAWLADTLWYKGD